MRRLKVKQLIFVCFLFITYDLISQTFYNYKKTRDTNEIKVLWDIGLNYQKKQIQDSAEICYRKSIILSKEIGNKLFEAKSSVRLAKYFYKFQFYDSSLVFFNRSIQYFKDTKDKYTLCDIFLGISNSYARLSRYPDALESANESYKLARENKNHEAISKCLNTIALIYKNQKNYKTAIDYLRQAIQENVYNKTDFENHSIVIYSNIGSVFYESKLYDSALKYQKSVITLYEKMNRSEFAGGSYLNLGLTLDDLKKYDEALFYYKKAEICFEKISQKYGLALVYMNTGSTYSSLKKHKLSKLNYEKSLEVSELINDIGLVSECCKSLSSIANDEKDYKKAYQYYVRYSILKDSIFNLENTNKISELRTQIEVEKKEAEFKIKAEAEKEKAKLLNDQQQFKQHLIILFISIVLLVVIVFLLILYRRFKLIKKQKYIIESKEIETRVQKELIEEKQHEILSSIRYAKRIQQALMPTEQTLKKYFKK